MSRPKTPDARKRKQERRKARRLERDSRQAVADAGPITTARERFYLEGTGTEEPRGLMNEERPE